MHLQKIKKKILRVKIKSYGNVRRRDEKNNNKYIVGFASGYRDME